MTGKKLIEVALPLEKINRACVTEKSIRHGHPSTLHLWWARRPLAAARAVIFSQMVDDPTAYLDVLRADPKLHRRAETALKAKMKLWEEARTLADDAKGTGLRVPEPGPAPTLDDILADQERQRLFRIIEDLVLWDNTTNETVLQAARDEIWNSWRRACVANVDHPRAKELFDRHKLPAFHDPFAGGGALPLEAQRLGLESYANDLNPVAVLINKAMIEIPPRFAGRPPVNPESGSVRTLMAREWTGAQGLAEDVHHYGQWMRVEAEKRIGHLYPRVEITAEMASVRPDLRSHVGQKLNVIAWLWARTVKSPNPAFAQVDVPLVSSFMLSTKAGKPVFIEPIVESGGYRFTVKVGEPRDMAALRIGTRAGKAQDFLCLMSGVPVLRSYIRDEGKAGRLGTRLMAIVAEGNKGRVYLSPSDVPDSSGLTLSEAATVDEAKRTFLSGSTPTRAMITGGVCSAYGLSTWGSLFTPRQLVALITFADLVHEARDRAKRDGIVFGHADDGKPLREGGTGATAYGEAVGVYLAFAIDRLAMTGNSLVRWNAVGEKAQHSFGRQGFPMLWDFAEPNFLSTSTGSVDAAVFYAYDPLNWMLPHAGGSSGQENAARQQTSADRVVSTDPPYYNNIAYADLSDFFYVWMRRSQQSTFPELFATVAVPKSEELVATPYRHGGQHQAEKFFLDGMTRAMKRLAEQTHPAYPVTIYYAFKQAETDGADGTTNTGWDTFLEAVIQAGFGITGTWPMRTEMRTRQNAMDANALASSIVLVCRRRAIGAAVATRREFVAALKAELPVALANLQRGNIAPVDLAQAAIGPGMAVYSRFDKVLDAQGRPLAVRDALALINATLDEALAEQEGDFDADTRWALTWFEHTGFSEGEYGVAETLSTSKNTSVAGMAEAGILESRRGKVRLLRPEELPADWDPATDRRLTAWEVVHHLIRVIGNEGEGAAAELVGKLGARAEVARELAYRLYTLCERKKRSSDALPYNGLVQSWPEITRLAQEGERLTPVQGGLFDDMGA